MHHLADSTRCQTVRCSGSLQAYTLATAAFQNSNLVIECSGILLCSWGLCLLRLLVIDSKHHPRRFEATLVILVSHSITSVAAKFYSVSIAVSNRHSLDADVSNMIGLNDLVVFCKHHGVQEAE